jgi:nucleoside-diphosphate-sugar epimerase
MRLFMTGATGVIGRRIIPLAIDAGHQVTAISRSAQNREALRNAGATPVDADLFDVASLRRAMAGHDAVINLATHMPSSSTAMMFRWAWRTNDRIRRDGSAAIAAAARAENVGRMIQESFAPIYPDRGDDWIDETVPVAPVSYNRTILDAERSAHRFTEGGGTGVVLRFGAMYGPDALLLEMLGMIRRGWSPLPGDPDAYFSSLAQDDAATAVLAALGVPAGVYNVIEDAPMRRGDWARSLAAAAGLGAPKPLPSWMTALGGSLFRFLARSLRISNRTFREASGWAPRYPNASSAWPNVLAELHAVGGERAA